MQAKILFLLKFLVLVLVLLPLWVFFGAEPYMVFLGHESAVLLRLMGYTILEVASKETRLYLQVDSQYSVNFEAIFATLNLILFVSLMLSTPKVGWRRFFGFLFGGLLILNAFQVLYVVIHFTVNFKYGADSSILKVVQSISEVAYLLLPMLIWALMEAPRLFRKRRLQSPAGSQAVST